MPPSNRTRWFILALLFFCRIGLGFQFQTLGSVSGELTEQLGLNYTEIGSLIGLFMVPGMILALPAGFAGRFMSDRFFIGLGLIALAAGGGLSAVADSFNFLAGGLAPRTPTPGQPLLRPPKLQANPYIFYHLGGRESGRPGVGVWGAKPPAPKKF